jgi:hypothetical protein
MKARWNQMTGQIDSEITEEERPRDGATDQRP